jgi:tRNA (cytidine56-2'-O)-methyltransferase
MVTVLRLGHRIPRDKRVTTHVALVARAFGAKRILVDARDEELEQSVKDVMKKFGNHFRIETGCSWRATIDEWKGKVVHLTMYGENLDDILPRIPRDEEVLVVIGSEKVPHDVFDMADFNVAVGNQPHSEVAALAVFLDRFFGGAQLSKPFEGRLRVIPSARGKNVVDTLPDNETCIEILRKAGCDEKVVEHCIAVNRLAVRIARLCFADVELVNVASLLHDIGRSKSHGIHHGIEGARILKEQGLPNEVVLIVEKHIGAGLDMEEVKRLGLPDGDYMPRTLEEKIVCHADSLISHDRKITLKDLMDRYRGQDLDKYIINLKKLHEELSGICGMDLDDIPMD